MRRLRYMLTIPLVSFLTVLLTNMSAYSDEIPSIKVSGPLFEPYIMIKEGSTKGIIVDLVQLALKEAGYQAKFDITNWARAFTETKKGLIDAIIPAMKSADREVFLHYPHQPVINLQMVLVAAKDNPATFDGTMESLRSYSIGRVRKARVSPVFDEARETGVINVQERNSFGLLIKAAAFDRIDLAALDKNLALWSSKKQGLSSRIRVLQPILGSVPVYVAFSKKRLSKKIATDVGNILERFHQDGTVDTLIERYLGSNYGE
ncbi:MAG: transporter substrate-binding domain-containing protein [SAR324 cluster bacterium]|nr:transporter substrate-binding domain-containing protein [SAR324 cluster bacterium]